MEVYLWPLLGFFVLGALGALWQARNPQADIAAREKLLERNVDAPRWRAMPLWKAYRAGQEDPVRHARSARRRAMALLIGAFAVALALARTI